MINYLTHQEIDLMKWDSVVCSSQYPLVFAQSFYLNATFPNWDALVFGDYECVFPVTKKTKFGISYLHQPPFTSQLGLYGKFTIDTEKEILDYLLKHYKLIEIELNASNKLASDNRGLKRTFIINYKNEIKQNKNTKRNIAKALELGFTIERIADNEIIKLSTKYINPFLSQSVNLTDSSIYLFNELLKSSINAKTLFSFKALDTQKNIKAIAHFISNGKHALYLKGLNFDKSENSGSMHLVMNSAIEFFRDKVEIFDFGGGSKESLANFYKGFGGEEFNYNTLKVNNLPWIIKVGITLKKYLK